MVCGFYKQGKVLYAPTKKEKTCPLQSVAADGQPHVLATVVGVWGRGSGVQGSSSDREGGVGMQLGGTQEAGGRGEGWVDVRVAVVAKDGRDVAWT